jgi:outer membrane protein TolC
MLARGGRLRRARRHGGLRAVGPDYAGPELPVAPAYRDWPEQMASIADLPWWDVFRDDALATLIREALESNRDLGTSTPKTIDSGAEEQIHERCRHPFRSFQNDSAQGKDSSGAAAYRFSTGNPSAPT